MSGERRSAASEVLAQGPSATILPHVAEDDGAVVSRGSPAGTASAATPSARRTPKVIFASESIKAKRAGGVEAALHSYENDDFSITSAEATLYSPPVPESSRGGGSGGAADDETPALDDDELQDFRDMIWDLISSIKDPEFELTLEDLKIVRERHVYVSRSPQGRPCVSVRFTPTVPHCSQATTIGLCLAHAVGGSVPNLKFSVHVAPGTHKLEREITRQINDKERVAAALENPTLRGIVTTLCQGVRGRG